MKKCIWNLPQLAVRNKFGHHIISNSRVALRSVSLHITLLIEVGRFDRLFWKPAKPDALAIAFAKGFLGLKFCRFIFLKKFGHQPEIRQNHTSCMIFLADKSTVSNLPTFLSSMEECRRPIVLSPVKEWSLKKTVTTALSASLLTMPPNLS